MKTKEQEVIWTQSCFDCAIKRGWTPDDILQDLSQHWSYAHGPYAFKCVHRTDLNGKFRICAAMAKKLKEWQDGV